MSSSKRTGSGGWRGKNTQRRSFLSAFEAMTQSGASQLTRNLSAIGNVALGRKESPISMEAIQVSTRPTGPTPGMTLWLNGRTGLTLGVGGGSGSWLDQSGNHFDFASGSGAPAAGTGINGRATADFNEASSWTLVNGIITWANIITASAWTMFAVWKYTGTTALANFNNSPQILSSEDTFFGPSDGIMAGETGGVVSASTYVSIGGTGFEANATDVAANPHYSTHQFSAGVLSTAVDAGSFVTHVGIGAVTLDTSPILIGRNSISTNANWKGSIGEIIVYNRALSAGEIAQTQNFLKNVWGF